MRLLKRSLLAALLTLPCLGRAADLPALGVSNTVDADALRAAGAGAVAKDLRDWMPESISLVFT